MKPLNVPPAAQRDDKAIQMLSAWIAEKGLHCSINIGLWQEHGHDEPAAWGILLADTVRHIAQALQKEYGRSSTDAIASIMKSLHNELNTPSAETPKELEAGEFEANPTGN